MNALVPGATDTDFRHFMSAETRSAFESGCPRAGPVRTHGITGGNRCARGVLLSDDAGYITGSRHVVDGGLLRR